MLTPTLSLFCIYMATAILIIIEVQFRVFQRLPSGKLALNTVETVSQPLLITRMAVVAAFAASNNLNYSKNVAKIVTKPRTKSKTT